MDNPVINMAKVINNRNLREARERAEQDIRVRRAAHMRQRRNAARANGYRGPLTREEAARIALQQF